MKQSATTKAALPEMLFIDRSGNVPSIAHKNGKDVIHEARLYSYNGPFGEELVLRYNAHEVLMQHWRESECYCADYVAAKGSCAHCAVRAALAQLERPA